MRHTVTDTYLQHIAQDNTTLLDGGVKRIRLIKLWWLGANIAGNSAPATTNETWRATYIDGHEEQSQDRNLYTLTESPSGWRIAADVFEVLGACRHAVVPGITPFWAQAVRGSR
jgi:hypothetical protein